MTKPKRADGLLTLLPEYLAATRPKKKGVDPVRSAKAAAHLAKEKAQAERFQRMCGATVGARRIPPPTLQYAAIPDRKFRIDFAWIEQRVGLECEGGTWIGGRFNYAKATLHAVAGWRILYCYPKDLLKGETILLVQQAIHGAEP